jgi:hypothetical protein
VLCGSQLDIRQVIMHDSIFKSNDYILRTPITTELLGSASIEILDLPKRLENALKKHGVETISEFVECPLQNIFKFRNIGHKSLKYLALIKEKIQIIPNDPTVSSIDINTVTQTINVQKKEEEEIAPELLFDMLLDKIGDERSRKIILYRYGLYDGKKRTLEEVGHLLLVTRERIRQIQSRIIRRMKHPLFKGKAPIITLVSKTLQKHGTIITSKEADTVIPIAFNNVQFDGSSFLDLLADLHWIQKYSHGDLCLFAPNNISINSVGKLMDNVFNVIKNSKQLMDISQISEELRNQNDEYKHFLDLYLVVFKICKLNPKIIEKFPGKFGLHSLQTKISYWRQQIAKILEENNTPLHFSVITEKLNSKLVPLGNKKVDTQKILGILIENPEFSHTGIRGTYGLTEWGFRKDTTSELVEESIRKVGHPVHWKEIYEYVRKYKNTKPANILAILHSQKNFTSLKRGVFDLKSLKKDGDNVSSNKILEIDETATKDSKSTSQSKIVSDSINFKEICRLSIDDKRDLVASYIKSKESIIINTFFKSGSFVGYSNRGVTILSKDVGEFVKYSLKTIATGETTSVTWKGSSKSKIMIQKVDDKKTNSLVDVRLYIETEKYTGFTKKGFRISSTKYKEFIDVLGKKMR